MHPNLSKGIELFNQARYHEAHDSFEEFWQEYQGADRQYYQALIQLTVAIYLKQEGRQLGAEKVLKRAEKNLAAYQANHGAIDLGYLAQACAAYIHGTQDSIPQIINSQDS